jgi:hypothetical protein
MALSFEGMTWLAGEIGDEPSLQKTRAALSRAAGGFTFAVPDGERTALREWLDRRIMSIGPRERSSAVTEMIMLRETLR